MNFLIEEKFMLLRLKEIMMTYYEELDSSDRKVVDAYFKFCRKYAPLDLDLES